MKCEISFAPTTDRVSRCKRKSQSATFLLRWEHCHGLALAAGFPLSFGRMMTRRFRRRSTMKIVISLAGAALFLTVLTVIHASAEERQAGRDQAASLFDVRNRPAPPVRRRLHPVWGHMPGCAKGNAGNRYCPNSGWVGDKWACNAKRIIQWEASHGPAPTR
jgi:hypothetical protein